jgi:hypothetical protein
LPVGNELKRLQEEHPDLEVEVIEVTTSPIRAWKDGIRGFPALKIGDDILIGFLLSPNKIRSLIQSHVKDEAVHR